MSGILNKNTLMLSECTVEILPCIILYHVKGVNLKRNESDLA